MTTNDVKTYHISSIVLDDTLYEQVYNPDNKEVAYVFSDNDEGTFSITNKIETDGAVYRPILNSDVTEKAILLPVEPLNYTSKSSLMDTIKGHIHSYVDLQPIYEDICSWYIMMTWVFDKMPSVPYLRFLGDFQTGKSRASKVVAGLCYHPFQFVMPSNAGLYHTIKTWKPTLRIDECEFNYSDKKADIVKILNAGYEQGNMIPRCSGEHYETVQYYDVFGPKIIANKSQFKDPSLENRCITILMKQTTRDDIPRNLTDDFYKEQMEIRNKLLTFRLQEYSHVDISKAQGIDLKGIDIRLQQITEGMISLFIDEPQTIEKMKKVLWEHHNLMVEERAEGFDGKMVSTLLQLHEEGLMHITSSDIAIRMENKYQEYDTIRASSIGKKLRKLGIQTTSPRKIDGQSKRYIIWDDKLINQLKKRYVKLDTTCTTDTTGFGGGGNANLDTFIPNINQNKDN